MMMALIYRDVVKGIYEKDFPVIDGLSWVDIPAQTTVDVGYYYKDGEFSKTDPEYNPPVQLDANREMILIICQYLLGNWTKEELQTFYEGFRDSK